LEKNQKLKCNFDFTKKSTYSIYAPNGIMKTSFANTFMDLSNARMYGDMQGIIGASLPEIKSLELKALTDETEVIS